MTMKKLMEGWRKKSALLKEERVTESEWGRGAGEYDQYMGRRTPGHPDYEEMPYPVGKTPLPDEGRGIHPLLGSGLTAVNLFGEDSEENRQKARAVRVQRGLDAGCPEGSEKSQGAGGCGEVPSADYLGGGTDEEYEIYAKYGAPFEGKYDSIEIDYEEDDQGDNLQEGVTKMKKEYLRNAIRMMKKETLQEAFKKADSRNELKESLAYNRDEDDLEEGTKKGDDVKDPLVKGEKGYTAQGEQGASPGETEVKDAEDLEEGAYPGDPNDIEGLMQDDPLGAAPVMPGKVAALQKHLDGLRSRNSGLPLSDEVKAAMSQLVQALRNQGLEVNEGHFSDPSYKGNQGYKAPGGGMEAVYAQNAAENAKTAKSRKAKWDREFHGDGHKDAADDAPDNLDANVFEETKGLQEMKKLVRTELKKYLKKQK